MLVVVGVVAVVLVVGSKYTMMAHIDVALSSYQQPVFSIHLYIDHFNYTGSVVL